MKMNSRLAEICGIHAGDGYLRDDGKRRELDLSGDFDEIDYYDNHVSHLFNKSFGISTKPRFFLSRRTYGFVIRDKEIVKVFHELGFPYGNKSTIVRVPSLIFKGRNKLIYARFLRGLFDTDGCVTFARRPKENYAKFKRTYHYYPSIRFSTVSKEFANEIMFLLKELQFGHITLNRYRSNNLKENIRYSLIFYGVNKLNRFFKIVGSKNMVKLSRYLIWKKFGFCSTNLTLQQRKGILSGKLNPYLICSIV